MGINGITIGDFSKFPINNDNHLLELRGLTKSVSPSILLLHEMKMKGKETINIGKQILRNNERTGEDA